MCSGNRNQTDMNFEEIPNEVPLTNRNHFNQAMDCIRNFELKQKRCYSDKNKIKMFSAANNMDPGILPPKLIGLSLTEQQLIAKFHHVYMFTSFNMEAPLQEVVTVLLFLKM